MSMDYIKTENGIQATTELKVKRLRERYKALFPLGCTREERFEVAKKVRALPGVKEAVQGSLFLWSENNVIKPACLELLAIKEFEERWLFQSAYSLMEIYLQHNEDIQSIEQLDAALIVIYLGVADFTNRRQGEIIQQLWDQQTMRGKPMWLLYKGSEASFKKTYPELADYVFKSKSIKTLHVSNGLPSESEEL